MSAKRADRGRSTRRLKRVEICLGPAEFAAIVSEHGFHRHVENSVEGQHIVVQHRETTEPGLFRGIQETEGVGALAAHTLDQADEEGVNRHQFVGH